jgi:hypothetical protein
MLIISEIINQMWGSPVIFSDAIKIANIEQGIMNVEVKGTFEL